MMKEINLKLSVDEINKVLSALGNMPYIQVFELINKISKQAETSLKNEGNKDEQPMMNDNGKFIKK